MVPGVDVVLRLLLPQRRKGPLDLQPLSISTICVNSSVEKRGFGGDSKLLNFVKKQKREWGELTCRLGLWPIACISPHSLT